MDFLPSLGTILLVIVTAVNIILAFVVYRSAPKKLTNRLFGVLSLDLSLTLIAMQLSFEPDRSPEFSLTWIRLSVFFAVPVVLLFYFLIRSIPNNTLELSKRAIVVYVLGSAVVMMLNLSSLVFAKVLPGDGVPQVVPGPAIVIFLAYVLGGTASLAYTLYKKAKNLKGLVQKQVLYIAFGALAMLGLVISTIIIPVALFQNTTFVPFFSLYTLIFTGAASYSILKHKLFDLKVVATEAITVILWIVLFSKIFISENIQQFAVDALILVAVVIFGVLLIKSVVREVKQRKKLEELTNRLKELDEQKDEFVNVAAHELRAPMTAIKGYLSMIQEGDAGEVNKEVSEYLQNAVDGNERLIRLVNNMLNVSRIEEGRMVFSMGEVDLNEVVKTVVHEYEEQAEQKGLKISLQTSEEARYHVQVDQDRIYEVVSNLISNAIKYTEKGSITVKVHLTNTSHVRVEVIDTGAGLTKDEIDHLFQKFYRAESNVGKQIGTGLGLYISKLLIQKFEGKIGVESDYGKGSNFWFELPLKK